MLICYVRYNCYYIEREMDCNFMTVFFIKCFFFLSYPAPTEAAGPTSNFSWEYMFRMLEPHRELEIQRPNVSPNPHPMYTVSWIHLSHGNVTNEYLFNKKIQDISIF